MRMYEVKHKTLHSHVCWDNFLGAVEELKTHLSEGDIGDVIEVSISEMSEEEYNNLKEFEGY